MESTFLLYLNNYQNQSSQRWFVDGNEIVTKVDDRWGLDVYYGSTHDGAVVGVYWRYGNPNQLWNRTTYIEQNSSGPG